MILTIETGNLNPFFHTDSIFFRVLKRVPSISQNDVSVWLDASPDRRDDVGHGDASENVADGDTNPFQRRRRRELAAEFVRNTWNGLAIRQGILKGEVSLYR
jgi:hypothetical protein